MRLDRVLPYLGRPDVNTLVKAAGGEELAVRGEGDTVDRLRVLRQGVNAGAPLHIPQPHSRVERSTSTGRKQHLTEASDHVIIHITHYGDPAT